MREIVETPAHLQESTELQQEVVPYLGLGFHKTRLPVDVWELVRDSVTRNLADFRPEGEETFIHTVEESIASSLVFEDTEVNPRVLDALLPLHEEWSGLRLRGTACYGPRIYQRGSYLYNHVDRAATHIVSGTLCIDSRLEEPWPLYIEDCDGKAHEVEIEPGELVFFEGARLRHGRPWPLRGDFYVSMFVHYAPPGWEIETDDIRGHLLEKGDPRFGANDA